MSRTATLTRKPATRTKRNPVDGYTDAEIAKYAPYGWCVCRCGIERAVGLGCSLPCA
jgi:hypothetical protein